MFVFIILMQSVTKKLSMDELVAIALGDEGSLDVNLNLMNITSDDEGHESLESLDGGGPGGNVVLSGELRCFCGWGGPEGWSSKACLWNETKEDDFSNLEGL
jgi:hypothetical protein